MAQFLPAYRIVRQHEGYYLNDPKDHGGETYAGVARNFYPGWPGWVRIDVYKTVYGQPRTNQQIPGVETFVESFYKQKWNASRAGEIMSQQVANIFFDFYMLAAKATATIQQVVNSLGARVTVDNRIGSQTIAAINSVNPVKLYQRFKAARIEYHKYRVNKGLVDAKFLPGWIRRTEQFPDLTSSNPWLLTAGVLTVSTLYLTINSKTRNQRINT